MQEPKGLIFNIQKYCVHDGPGIRDVVFMKGCPLKCIWCSNPESQSPKPQLAYNSTKCILCGACIKACAYAALSVEREKIVINRDKCVNCHQCVKACCSNALHVFGQTMTITETFKKTQNQTGAWRSNGGITISGGEPLLQADFVAALLKKYRSVGVHTAIETTGFAPWENLEKVAQWCSLIFYDVKMINTEKHIKYTGVDNTIILDNLRKLCNSFPDVDIIVRTPVIPDVNNQESDILKIAKFLQTLPKLSDYELLPYHGYGSSKYEQIGEVYQLKHVASLPKEPIEELNHHVRKMLNLVEENI